MLPLALSACEGSDDAPLPPAPPTTVEVFANRVIAYAPMIRADVTEELWPYFFQPEAATGAPGGTFSVASLGYERDRPMQPGGSITLGLGDPDDPDGRYCIAEAGGPDFIVYENAFRYGDIDGDPATDDPGTVNEVATVEVSEDNTNWYAFPASVDASRPLLDPARYTNFAGVYPTAEGGDPFDLEEVIAAHGLPGTFRACYLRLTDGGTLHEDFVNTQSDETDSGADIDAVEAIHFAPAPGLAP